MSPSISPRFTITSTLFACSQGEFIEQSCGKNGLGGLAIDTASDHLTEGIGSHTVCINHAKQALVLVSLPMRMEYQEYDRPGTSRFGEVAQVHER